MSRQADIRTAILSLIKQDHRTEDFDILDEHILDSLGFLEFLEKIEKRFDIEIDFEDNEPMDLARVSNLVEVIAKCMEDSNG